jgi:D-arabinose 1-dehydrogenase
MTDIHDSEFNSSITPPAGDPTRALKSSVKYDQEYAIACGLEAEKQGQIRGEGDKKILDAIQVLRRMKSAGKIKKIGLAGMSIESGSLIQMARD